MTTKEFNKMPVSAINKLSVSEIDDALKDIALSDVKSLTSLKFTLYKEDSEVYVSKCVHDVVQANVKAFLKTVTLEQVETNNLFYSLIGICGEFYAYSQAVAVDICYKNIKGNSSVCCVQFCRFKDGLMMITHGWDSARPRFGKLLHKENQFYFSKVDFVDLRKFRKVEKPFGFFN